MAHHQEQDHQSLPSHSEAEITVAEEAFQKKAGVLDSEWGQEMLANIKRMTVDEEYRKQIAKKLS